MSDNQCLVEFIRMRHRGSLLSTIALFHFDAAPILEWTGTENEHDSSTTVEYTDHKVLARVK